MKKLLLPLSLGLLVSAAASAQITLTQASFASASTSGADTLLNTATNPTYPALTADAGNNLDFTGATSNTNSSILYRVAGTTGSQWADSLVLSFSGFNYNAKLESSLSATAYTENGEHIDRVAYSLSALQGSSASDSLVINGQDIAFSAPRKRIVFPATNQSTWSSTYQYDFNFTLSYAIVGLNHAAGIVRAYITQKDTVIGYGKVKVQTKNGSGSQYIDVLQIASTISTTDSFFVAGASPVIMAALLANFHASQGAAIVTKEQNYFRAGELTPLVHVTMDSTGAPTSAQTQAARLPVSIPVTELTRTLNVYPNPVTNHTIMVSGATANYGTWNYELQGVNGQTVTKGALQLNTNNAKTSIALPTSIAPGTYFLHMNNGAAQEAVKTLTIQ